MSHDGERSGFGSLRLRGRIWWLRYRIGGKEHWESSHSTSRKVAERLLVRRRTELDHGILTEPDARRVRFEDLETIVRADYRTRGRRSLARVEIALTHLRETFGSNRALAITADRIAAYEATRLEAKAARATVNYELATLRRAFRLAVRHRRLPSVPAISIPAPRNARTGFFAADDFAAVLEQLPEYLRPVMHFGYLTGWRVRSEVLPLTWDRVDFAAGVVRLEPNTTKNDEGREFPFDALPELKDLLERQRAATKGLERSIGRIIPHVFHRGGAPIKGYTRAWEAAVQRAARGGSTEKLAEITRPQLVGRIVHDFRRTAVRNLVRAGVPEGVAMRLTGHRTRAVFERYNIVNTADLKAGIEKLAAHLSPYARESKQGNDAAKGTTGGQSALKAI
jgi:site-specific recombinase XerD